MFLQLLNTNPRMLENLIECAELQIAIVVGYRHGWRMVIFVHDDIAARLMVNKKAHTFKGSDQLS